MELDLVKFKNYICANFATQTEAARKIGLKKSTLSKILSGSRHAGFKSVFLIKVFSSKNNLGDHFFICSK